MGEGRMCEIQEMESYSDFNRVWGTGVATTGGSGQVSPSVCLGRFERRKNESLVFQQALMTCNLESAPGKAT
jgi:hypothetical protein